VLFDACKKFNVLLCFLSAKRKKLGEADSMLIMMEKTPQPGTLPWVLEAKMGFIRLENTIESVTGQFLFYKFKPNLPPLSISAATFADYLSR